MSAPANAGPTAGSSGEDLRARAVRADAKKRLSKPYMGFAYSPRIPRMVRKS